MKRCYPASKTRVGAKKERAGTFFNSSPPQSLKLKYILKERVDDIKYLIFVLGLNDSENGENLQIGLDEVFGEFYIPLNLLMISGKIFPEYIPSLNNSIRELLMINEGTLQQLAKLIIEQMINFVNQAHESGIHCIIHSVGDVALKTMQVGFQVKEVPLTESIQFVNLPMRRIADTDLLMKRLTNISIFVPWHHCYFFECNTQLNDDDDDDDGFVKKTIHESLKYCKSIAFMICRQKRVEVRDLLTFHEE